MALTKEEEAVEAAVLKLSRDLQTEIGILRFVTTSEDRRKLRDWIENKVNQGDLPAGMARLRSAIYQLKIAMGDDQSRK